MTKLYLDLETYSETPIKNGTHAYAENAEIMLFAWAIDDAPVRVWDLTTGRPMPDALYSAWTAPAIEIVAHNSHFDRTVLRHAFHSWPPLITHWRDTMVQALAHSLPASLGSLCEVLRVPTDQAKDKDGKALIQLFCKPRPTNSIVRRATRKTHPDEWARFVEYAARDIDAMRACEKRMPSWNYQAGELALWHLDQTINDRGVAVDVEMAQAAIRAVGIAQSQLAARAAEATNGGVASATQRDAMLRHILAQYGITLPDMKKSTIERRIADPDLPAGLRELLAIRLQACTTSTAKYGTLIKGVSSDGRLRGTLQFNGASRTGRWAGRLFQPQNLPRPTLPQELIDAGIEALKADCADLVFPDVMELTSSAIRGCLVAPPGRKLVVSDLSNIEGRAQAWLAGEQWKLDAFRAFDAGQGHDLYKLAYAKSFGVKPESVTKDQRQIGKVQELALGYEGGVGAFLTFAAAYGIDLEAMADQALDAIPQEIINESNSALAWTRLNKRDTFGLSDRAWIVCDSFKRSWRYAHPAIASTWGRLGNAVREAIGRPGNTIPCDSLKVHKSGAWLRIVLPSGRSLCYPSAALDGDVITYMGTNQYSRKWSRLNTYGGKLFENVCQAVARDVMTANMPHIEAAGYQIVLTVHDEVICEAPDSDEFNAAHLSALLAAPPSWAQDMPLAAGGFEAYRYKKD